MAHPTTDTPAGQDLVELVESLVRGLATYRQQVQLYPPDHPRVQDRIKQLHEELSVFMRVRKKVFVLQVREGILFSSNQPLSDSSAAVHRFAAFLRERMIRLIQLSPGVTQEEIRDFILLLLRDPKDLVQEIRQSTKIGPSLTIYHFPPSFGDDRPVTEEEILAGAKEDAAILHEIEVATDGHGDWRASDWITFDREQLHAVARVVKQEPLRSRIEAMRGLWGLDREGKDFLPAYLEILRRDVRTDWDNLEGLTELISSGLRFLEDAAEEVREDRGALETLLVPETPDEIPTHVRWRLMGTFFPGACPRRAAVEDEDPDPTVSWGQVPDHDDFDWQNKGAGWTLPEVSDESWGKTDPAQLHGVFDEQFSAPQIFKECAAMLDELTTLGSGLPADGLRDGVIRGLTADAHDGRSTRKELETLLNSIDHLSEESKQAWKSDVLCVFARPEDVLQDLVGDDPTELVALLREPPSRLDSVPAEGGRGRLHRILLRADDLALETLLEVVAQASTLGDGQIWSRIVRETCARHREFSKWFLKRISAVCLPSALDFLLAVVDDDTVDTLRAHYLKVGAHHLLPVLAKYGARPAHENCKLLRLALDLGPTSVRCEVINILGLQKDAGCLGILRTLLEEQNDVEPCMQQVVAICEALARDRRGQTFLNKVVSERSGVMRYRWKRAIRGSAATCLKYAS